MSVNVQITELEKATWQDLWSADINPIQASSYGHKYVPGLGLCLQMYHNKPEFGGWLCKNSSPFYAATPNNSLVMDMVIDSMTVPNAQVIELDRKITDAAGWTYDLSAQFNLVKDPKGWLLQVSGSGTWADTNVIIPPIPANMIATIAINANMDYSAHTCAVTSLDVTIAGQLAHYAVTNPAPVPAKQLNWTKNSIVTQLQQCNNGKPGGYTLIFPKIGYTLS